MKTKEELNKLKEEYTDLNKKLTELSEEELLLVTGWAESCCDILIDEDKARERAEFEKALIYEQTSQEMLARANSSAADVIGSLQ